MGLSVRTKGVLLFIGSLVFFLWNAYALFISKLLPTPSSHQHPVSKKIN